MKLKSKPPSYDRLSELGPSKVTRPTPGWAIRVDPLPMRAKPELSDSRVSLRASRWLTATPSLLARALQGPLP